MDEVPRRLRQLGTQECLRLLASVPVGRVAFTHHALPAICPVSHLVDGGDVIIRTHRGAAVVPATADKTVVAFEVDDLHPAQRLGWSVLVTGVAEPVTDPVLVARYRDVLRPWVAVGEPVDLLIRIGTEFVTGFAVEPG